MANESLLDADACFLDQLAEARYIVSDQPGEFRRASDTSNRKRFFPAPGWAPVCRRAALRLAACGRWWRPTLEVKGARLHKRRHIQQCRRALSCRRNAPTRFWLSVGDAETSSVSRRNLNAGPSPCAEARYHPGASRSIPSAVLRAPLPPEAVDARDALWQRTSSLPFTGGDGCPSTTGSPRSAHLEVMTVSSLL